MQRISRHLFLCTLCALASVVLSAQGVVITGRVTDAQRKHAKKYAPADEFERQMEKAFKQHARDIEYALVFDRSPRAE